MKSSHPATFVYNHICDNGLEMGSRTKFHSHALSAAIPDKLLPVPRCGSSLRSPERLRQWFGLSQGEIAEVIGVSRQTVNR
jgi:hypothetical protein